MTGNDIKGTKKGSDKMEFGWDLLAQLRDSPRVKPRFLFRLKVAWYSRVIGLRNPRASGQSLEGNRVLGIISFSAAAVFVLVCVFGGLILASTGSHPGDALYSFKKTRERIALTLTLNPVDKAEKQLETGQERLKELDYLIRNNDLDSNTLEFLAREYKQATFKAKSVVASSQDGSAIKKLEEKLAVVENEKNKVVASAASIPGSAGTSSPVEGALVTISDASGRRSLNNGVATCIGKSDRSGSVKVDYDSTTKDRATDLQAIVGFDGCEASSPLYPSTQLRQDNDNQVVVSIAPIRTSIPIGHPMSYSLVATSPSGIPIVNATLLIRDRTGSCLINGLPGRAEVLTDGSGRCKFELCKTSGAVSRLSLEVKGKGFVAEINDLLAVGAQRRSVADSTHEPVSAIISPGENDSYAITMDNGLISVVGSAKEQGAVIESLAVSKSTNGNSATLIDPEVAERSRDKGVEVISYGPYLFLNSDEVAGYEIAFESKKGTTLYRKSYRVTLYAGDAFATVASDSSLVEGTDGPASLQRVSFDHQVLSLSFNNGLVDPSAQFMRKSDGETTLEISRDQPLAALKTGGVDFSVLCPDSAHGTLMLEDNRLEVSLSGDDTSASGGAGTTFLLGFLNANEAANIVATHRNEKDRSLIPGEQVRPESASAFNLEVEPPLTGVRPDRVTITLKVTRQFKNLEDYFE